ncbi:MAG: cytochrome c [Acidobacteria bacterium]|nr:cytochrome c [Acidobacteriota bacterium]MCL5288841.1 cytochrome c [Acidobacteriota bacterium]
MNRTLVNVLLLFVLLASVGLVLASRRDPATTNYEFIPEMAHSPRYNAFSPNPHLAGGMTLQPPVPGTIPRGNLPLHYQATPEDSLRAGEELKNPFSYDDGRALDRGMFVYVNFCQTCHGPLGLGDGTVTQRGFPAPLSLIAPHAVGMKDGQMFHIVSYGQKNMASYAAQVSREDRWKVVLYVRSLQKQAAEAAKQAGTPPAAPQATTASAQAGVKQ